MLKLPHLVHHIAYEGIIIHLYNSITLISGLQKNNGSKQRKAVYCHT